MLCDFTTVLFSLSPLRKDYKHPTLTLGKLKWLSKIPLIRNGMAAIPKRNRKMIKIKFLHCLEVWTRSSLNWHSEEIFGTKWSNLRIEKQKQAWFWYENESANLSARHLNLSGLTEWQHLKGLKSITVTAKSLWRCYYFISKNKMMVIEPFINNSKALWNITDDNLLCHQIVILVKVVNDATPW